VLDEGMIFLQFFFARKRIRTSTKETKTTERILAIVMSFSNNSQSIIQTAQTKSLSSLFPIDSFFHIEFFTFSLRHE